MEKSLPLWLQIIFSAAPVLIIVIGWYITWNSHVKQKRKDERLRHLKESFFLLKKYVPLMKEAESIDGLPLEAQKMLLQQKLNLKREAVTGISQAIYNIQLFGNDAEQKQAQNLYQEKEEGILELNNKEIDKMLTILRENFLKEIDQKTSLGYDSKWAAFQYWEGDFKLNTGNKE